MVGCDAPPVRGLGRRARSPSCCRGREDEQEPQPALRSSARLPLPASMCVSAGVGARGRQRGVPVSVLAGGY